jgi:hypothetical protein
MKVTAEEAGRILRRRAQNLDREVMAAERDALEFAKKKAVELSSGPLTSAMLRQMGHPYRIGGSPPANPAIINAQHPGGFRDSWKVEGPRKQGAGLVSKIVNLAPYAGFIFGAPGGRSRMMARPILAAIAKSVSSWRYRRHLEATRKALRGD